METHLNPSRDRWPEVLARPANDSSGLRTDVAQMLQRVKAGGDRALVEMTREFDGIGIGDLSVPGQELAEAGKSLSRRLKQAIATARQNIEKFHSALKTDDHLVVTSPGVKCWTRTVAIDRVGLYIPGGTAPLMSTVLMLGIPARLAGCREIVLCTPPGRDGRVHPAVLYCAGLLGIKRVFRVGGAQAIAAMAYGTETIPKVDKIFGPGNRYVMAAKQLVSLENVAVDLPAGPSEVAIIADETSDPAFVAADLIAQAEHGPDSQVLLVSQDEGLARAVQEELVKQLARLPRKELAGQSLRNSRIVVLETREEIIDLVNAYAPEHLIIMCRDYGDTGIQIRNAGSVFMGNCTPVSAGDYASGTNHTLPTGGYARGQGGLGISDFQKKISFQEISEEGLQNLGPAIISMAREEELEGHAKSVEIRLSRISDKKY